MAQEQPSASTSPFDLNWPEPQGRAELDWLMVGALETVAHAFVCWETLSPHLDPGLQETEPGLSYPRHGGFVHRRGQRIIQHLW